MSRIVCSDEGYKVHYCSSPSVQSRPWCVEPASDSLPSPFSPSSGVAGSPPLGSRGTVVGVHEGAVEVLFDADFIGGGDLQGRCQGRCGVMLPPADLLNLAKPHFSNVTGAHQSQCEPPCITALDD